MAPEVQSINMESPGMRNSGSLSESKRVLRTMAYIGLAVALSGCSRYPPDTRHLLEMSGSQREVEFGRLGLEKQLSLLPSLMAAIKPTPVGLPLIIAKQGDAAVPSVVDMITSDNYIRDDVYYLEILTDMKRIGKYDLCKDQKVLNRISPRYGPDKADTWHLRYALDLISTCMVNKSSV
jgi:hypothetical protein